jgi:hypothetical protein
MTATSSNLGIALVALGRAAAMVMWTALPVSAQEGERRVILASVIDRDGNQVPGLGTANFRGEFRGRSVTIASATPDKAPRRVAVVVDTSGSESGVSVWKAVEELVGSLAPVNSVVILTMAATLQKHSDLTNDKQALQGAIREARAEKAYGPTSVYDGALQASRGFSSTNLGDTVCLVTDAEDTSSRLDSNEVTAAVARRGVRVFVVRTQKARSAISNPGMYQYATDWIIAITKATGGSRYSLEELQKDGMARALATMITEGYRLEVQVPETTDKTGEWKLQAIGADGKKLPNVRFVYPAVMPSPVRGAN